MENRVCIWGQQVAFLAWVHEYTTLASGGTPMICQQQSTPQPSPAPGALRHPSWAPPWHGSQIAVDEGEGGMTPVGGRHGEEAVGVMTTVIEEDPRGPRRPRHSMHALCC